jgi:UPF0755 protein
MKSKNKFWFVVIILAVVFISTWLFYKEGSLAVDKNSRETKTFIIPKGQSLNQITNSLEQEGLIRNRIVFFLIVKQLGIEKQIQAGEYRLSPKLSATELAKQLTQGTLETWVTIVEGLRKQEIAELLSKELGLSEVEFNNKAQEGYLFPDTYLVPKDATVETVLTILKNNFESKYTDEMGEKARQKGLTRQQVVTLASLVEREALYDADRERVASALLARLKKGSPLQIDATVQYALGYQVAEKRWWKKEVNLDDLKFDSPYNTYRVPGLPAGPICSPGLASLQAVVNANANTDYVFYVSDKQGHLHFARTSEEHQANIDKYLN